MKKHAEIIEEINRTKREEEEMKQYIISKKKNEKSEILKFKEEEIQEKRRIKELVKEENRKQLMDDVARGIERSELIKHVPNIFDSSLFDISNV